MHYVPEAPSLENARIEKSFIQYLVYQTAFIATTIEQNDNAALGMRAKELLSDIKEWASEKSTDTKTISDTESSEYGYF